MENYCLKYRGKYLYYQSEDLWVSYKEISGNLYNPQLDHGEGNKRFVKISKFSYIITSNFWKTYKLVKKAINEQELKRNKYFDDTNNKSVTRRYCVSDGEYIITDDFWSSFYFSKYHGNRILDNSTVLKTRITAIDDNNKFVLTNDFYKTYDIIEDHTAEQLDKEQKTTAVNNFFKTSKYIADVTASNAQKKCLCYIKYKYNIGKVIMLKLDEIHLNNKMTSNSGYGDEFEIFAMQRIMHLDEVQNNIVHGSKDGKVDAIFKDVNGAKLEFFQIKFLTGIKPEHLITMKENSDLAVDENHYEELAKDEYKASHLVTFMNEHKDYLNYGYRLNLVSDPIFGMNLDENSEYSFVDGKGSMFNVKFYNASDIVMQYVKDYLLGNLGERKLSVPVKKFVQAENCEDYFLFVNAKELCDSISKSFSSREEIDELFINNVRGYLGENSKMVKTIQSPTENTKFSLYNNGVSICCHNVDSRSVNKFFVLVNPYIVNGQQTILSLYSEFQNGTDLSKVEVPLFIKPYQNDENQMLNIAIYNNTQSPVKEIDLLCGDLNVREISKNIIRKNCEKHNNNFDEWLALKMFSTGTNSNIEISNLVMPKGNIIAVNDYFKIMLPIIFFYKTRDITIDMQLGKFNKNTTKYKDLYLKCIDEIKEFLASDNDFYYKIAECAKKAKEYVKTTNNKAYLPAENIFGIAYFFGKTSQEMCDELENIGYNEAASVNDRIKFLCKTNTCNSLQEFFTEGRVWNNFELE